jgi:predicted dienelactone hydrolase
LRLFEFLIILVNALSLLIWLLPVISVRWVPFFSAASVVFTLLHFGIEGYRWQMIPLYLLTAVLLTQSLFSLRSNRTVRPRWIVPSIGLIVLLFSSLPLVLLPIPRPLQPSGPYPVGTISFEWIDDSRLELYSPETGSTRRIMVQVWYPAETGPNLERAPYLEEIKLAAGAIAENFDLPSFLLGHLHLARTNAYTAAPLSDASIRYPVLLFSHGWTGMRVQNTYQMEELASYGYIIFSPDHTYGSIATIFPNGEIVFNNPDALPPRGTPPDEYDRVARGLGQTWVNDLRFVLAQAALLDSGEVGSPLAGRLDLEQVGVLGHSTGGGAAIEFCWIEAQCKAGLAMDAWLIPYDREMLSTGIGKPILLMQSESWSANRNPPLVDELYAHLPQDSRFRITLMGTAHYDFTDIPQLTALGPFIGLSGSGAGEQTLRVINAFSVAYFDRYLTGDTEIDIRGLAQQYPNVRVEEQR